MDCQKCGRRPATLTWVGDSGVLAFVHGMSQRWCEVCVLEEQLVFAQTSAKSIEGLEQRLAAARAANAVDPHAGSTGTPSTREKKPKV